jgi:nitrogen fixation/metabolism regulation signal transduction histidine kinase
MKRMCRKFRRHLAPLAGDTLSTLNLPPVRVSLLTKFNLLTVGLLFLAAAAITAVLFWRQWNDEERQIGVHGETIALMLADLSEYGMRAQDRGSLAQIIDSLPETSDIAYVCVLDEDGRVVSERYIATGFDGSIVPTMTVAEMPTPGQRAIRIERQLAAGRALEIIARIAGSPGRLPQGAQALNAAAASSSVQSTLGFVRVGLTFERQRRMLAGQLAVALSVVTVLLFIAAMGTMLLTRGLVSPMRRLMRAARAVGAGRLDVFVPARSADELGLLTHTFNHMTAKLAESKAEVANY